MFSGSMLIKIIFVSHLVDISMEGGESRLASHCYVLEIPPVSNLTNLQQEESLQGLIQGPNCNPNFKPWSNEELETSDPKDVSNSWWKRSSLGVEKGKMRMRRKMREPRFCFQTRSDVDVLDDGYKWRKYGQKTVKNSLHPRSYFRCTHHNCRVKKKVERLSEDCRMVITTYEGRHTHTPDDTNSSEPECFSSF
ncbi:uncharacterized protein A4U43_C04F31730 [Asparagus officinalis]|uniref:WRKY domain-containing protein n=1 Tax=Asparagus officinalis TaxID=4686 RepID=A0A5P1F516_ASPOF|nr:probable WRKY transcription factor 12 isoform X2 [Asparagus officinalis]ONK73458.1 uncharacterized protein A4U43_C04F31730 [Asparagus officinalis]